MKKIIPTLLVLVLLTLSGCSNISNSNQATEQPATSPESTLKKISIMLDWYPNAVHSLIYVAQENGYFAEQGLEVDIQMPAETNDSLKLVAAEKVDLALSYQPQILMARGEGIPVTSIAAIVRHPLNHLMVPAHGTIQSPKDLTGLTVGYSSIPLYEAMVHTMIKHDGGDPDNVKMVDVGYDLIPAIATSNVDAIMGGFINHEQLILTKQDHPVIALDPTDYGVPDYYELVLVTSDQNLRDKKELLAKFITAIADGQQFVQQHPEEALTILFEHEDQTSPLDKDIETKSLQILLPLMDAEEQTFGYQAPESWETVNQWLIKNKLLPDTVKAKDAFINL
ncbi:ABC transporter substrate-binding protein [Paenibacillus crassostreae]|uniref:ABC transporter substrate-binding protein n=2 Tax=Paenibacillus crassostreae TaxID=1763538 RepID=A0A167G612_9BACL|nr:ABC transporter substrate-binding protein [Paenibacillus crassostreae]OAB77244.1 ABC transporter substrate-binding protein [Paenibacillus crassostreae]